MASGHSWIAIAAVILLCAGQSAKATSITINPTFDSSLTLSDQGAIDAAIDVIEADIASPNNITVNIYYNSMSTGLGASDTTTYSVSYDDYYNAFKAVATSPDQLTALASLGTPPTSESSGNPVNGNTMIDITSAEGRNLGFDTPGGLTSSGTCCSGAYDGVVSLNTLITSPPNSLSGNYSLESVAMHETDEVLGIGGTGSTLDGTGSLTGPVGDLDLYRYSAPGVRSYTNANSTNPVAYFSIDGGTTVQSYFNQTNGADFGDWLSNCTSVDCTNDIPNGFGVQVQDAYGTPGTNPVLGASELTAFNAIGYQVGVPVVVPEPSTLLLTGLVLALGYSFNRRKRMAA